LLEGRRDPNSVKNCERADERATKRGRNAAFGDFRGARTTKRIERKAEYAWTLQATENSFAAQELGGEQPIEIGFDVPRRAMLCRRSFARKRKDKRIREAV